MNGALEAERFGRRVREFYGSVGESDVEGRWYNVQSMYQAVENLLPASMQAGMISPSAIVDGTKT